ncbi:MAG TPA: GNAT family N-acyltransferase [Bdellovibrionales bacterium]|nr:GNAT family N-acyltransferase [Bdellovibrionales bacterium]
MNSTRKFDDKDQSTIHGTIRPADVREHDSITAEVISVDPKIRFKKTMRVWRMSPLGVEILCNDADLLPKGLSVDIELKVGFQSTTLSGLVVDDVVQEAGRHLLHIRLVPRIKERVESMERRKSARWICSEDFYPTAVASNPALFNDFIYFRVRDLSFGGLQLQTSLRNKFIVPGMIFECIVNFPMVSQVKMKIQIKAVRVDLQYGKEVLSMGATFDTNDKHIVQTVGQYLMQFSSVSSLRELRKDGLIVDSVAEAIQFCYVRTKEEYEQVLELRREAYVEAGKIVESKTAFDMADELDSRARIVIGKYKGKIVASARLIFNRFEDQMEQEKFVRWPMELPRRDEMVEITRMCTRPDFRKSDLLTSMLRFIAITVVQSKRCWIVICATDEMVPLYAKIGFHKVGLDYPHVALNNKIHHVMLANVPDAMEGKTVGPVVWNLVWSEVSSYLEQYGLIQPEPLTNVRLAIYRMLRPFAKFAYYLSKRRAITKAMNPKRDQIAAPATKPVPPRDRPSEKQSDQAGA